MSVILSSFAATPALTHSTILSGDAYFLCAFRLRMWISLQVSRPDIVSTHHVEGGKFCRGRAGLSRRQRVPFPDRRVTEGHTTVKVKPQITYG